MTETREETGTSKKTVWAKRLGVGAFVFFLVKGLLWLTVPALVIAATR